MPEKTERLGLIMRPLDTMFFRDGRPFASGHRSESGLPAPQTFTGALRSHLLLCAGADFTALSRAARSGAALAESIRAAGAPGWIAEISVRGPWLAELSGHGAPPSPWLEAPANLRPSGGEGAPFVQLSPRRQAMPGWDGACGMKPLWNPAAKRVKSREVRYIGFSSLKDYLSGNGLPSSALRKADSLYGFDDRTGIAVDPGTFVARESFIYSSRMLVLAKNVCLYGEICAPSGGELRKVFASPGPMGFGGEGRYVEVRATGPLSWPSVQGKTTLLYLASPAVFKDTWKPDLLGDGARMVSAAVDDPFAVSGWDMALGGPKPTRFGVRAGTVYFLDGPAPAGDSLCAAPSDAMQGYGFYLKGVWNYV